MLIHAFLPDIHQRPTGENLFNRRVPAYLDGVAGLGAVDPERMAQARPPQLPALSGRLGNHTTC
ncbi:MAG TPA: hypothetical protein VGG06_32525 [Thermoanaerobaculia bacterium]|jgi:hypothetical protein